LIPPTVIFKGFILKDKSCSDNLISAPVLAHSTKKNMLFFSLYRYIILILGWIRGLNKIWKYLNGF